MRKKIIAWILAVVMTVSMTACGQRTSAPIGDTEDAVELTTELGLNAEEKDATEYTLQVNSAVYSLLDFHRF